MSVAAMTMDDQRPLMNTYDKMSKQYEHNLHGHSGLGGGGGVVGGSGGNGGNGMGAGGAPPSGPASPTPSGSEELQHHQYHHSHHHHSQHYHHHHQPRHMHQQHIIAHHSNMPSDHQPPSPPLLPLPPIQQQQLHMHHHNQHHQTQMHQQQHQQQQQQQQLQEPSSIAEAVAAAEHRQRMLEDEIESLKLEQARLSQQCLDAQRREKILMRRLANKEQEFQDYVSQIAEYKAAQAPSAMALRSALLDPAVNLLFEKLKKELKATKAKLEETQNELSAWKFTPDSNTGKRLIAKCRLLYQENEELGKMTSNGRLAKLETELAMQKSFCEEVKKSQSEVDDFLPELDEDVEGMQSTILFLQQELKTTRDRIQTLEKENFQLKTGITDTSAESKAVDTTATDIKDGKNAVINGANAAVPVNMKIESADNCATSNLNAAVMPNNANNIANSALPTTSHIAPQTLVNELKFKAAPRPLATIAEDVSAFDAPFNGSEGGKQQPKSLETDSNTTNIPAAATAAAIGNNNAMLRTVASRKRNYECNESNPNPNEGQCAFTAVAPAITTPTHLTAPRTLPPKKSKLRRSSVQSQEMSNEYDAGGAVVGGSGGMPAMDPLSIVDNAVVGMANEEHPSGMTMGEASSSAAASSSSAVMDSTNAGGVALRIMTRRRSVRQQQQQQPPNGNIVGDGNH